MSSIIQQELKQNRKRERRKDAPGGELESEHGKDRDGVPCRRLALRPHVSGLPQQRRHRRADAEADRHCGKAEGTR